MTRTSQCECTGPGDCERHGIQKDQHLFKLCQVRGPLNFDGWWGYYGEGGQATSGQPPQCAHGGKTDECPRCLAQLNNWSLSRESDKRQAHKLPIGGHTYRLIEGGCKQCKVGSWLWPAGLALAQELAQRDLRGLTCLDLGCGLGLAGMVAARRGASVTWADKEQVTALKCEENITANGLSGRVLVHDWANPLPQRFDMIVAGDILYGDLDRLREFVAAHWTGRGPCLLADSLRGHERFAKDLGRHGINFTTRELTGSLIDGRTFAVDLMELRKVQPNEKLLTIGMATRGGERAAEIIAFMLVANHALHREAWEQCEKIIVVNKKGGCPYIASIAEKCGARYIVADEVQGTAYPRDRMIREATGQYTLLCDDHIVLTEPGSLARLIEDLASGKYQHDLLTGPIITERLEVFATECGPSWGNGMLCQWHRHDPLPTEPREIFAHGCGLLVVKTDRWKELGGFNPHLRGFGGEEGYIHQVFRNAGGKCWSMPYLKWWHLFRDGSVDLLPFFRNNLIVRRQLAGGPGTLPEEWKDNPIAQKLAAGDPADVIEHYARGWPGAGGQWTGLTPEQMAPIIEEIFGDDDGKGIDGEGGRGQRSPDAANHQGSGEGAVPASPRPGDIAHGDNQREPAHRDRDGEVRVRPADAARRQADAAVRDYSQPAGHVGANDLLAIVQARLAGDVTDREYAGQQQAAAEFGP